MNITKELLRFALLGADWVLWLLVALSVISVAIMIERGRFFFARRVDMDRLLHDIKKALTDRNPQRAKEQYGRSLAMPAVVALRGLAEAERGVDTAAEAMNGEKMRAKQEHERNLVVLGTLGNNAPFIGLFGTVLGIIRAFRDLSLDTAAGEQAVITGIYEALVATAVGLLVAIPAVVAFNFFNRRVRAAVTSTDEIAHAILGELHARRGGEAA
jgi:biopolymer transport protein ExbB